MCEEYSIFGGNCDDVLVPIDAQCPHGNFYDDCSLCNPIPIEEEIDEPFDDNVEVDICLNCGRYKATDSLNENQVCIKPCRNPNEY